MGRMGCPKAYRDGLRGLHSNDGWLRTGGWLPCHGAFFLSSHFMDYGVDRACFCMSSDDRSRC